MRAGFTLVEVMVAVAVAALLIGGVTASIQATVRTAERQKSDARAEERRARAVELFRDEWRGRLAVGRPPIAPPAGTRAFMLSTTADSIAEAGARGIRLVTYEASENGLSRREGAAQVLLLPGLVEIDFWDGVAWRAEPDGRRSAARLHFQLPEEFVVFR